MNYGSSTDLEGSLESVLHVNAFIHFKRLPLRLEVTSVGTLSLRMSGFIVNSYILLKRAVEMNIGLYTQTFSKAKTHRGPSPPSCHGVPLNCLHIQPQGNACIPVSVISIDHKEQRPHQ